MNRLRAARSISVSATQQAAFLEELERVRPTDAQLRNAEAWLIYGNWQFKGANPVVELSDFFPTDEHLVHTARGANLILMSLAERQQMCRREYDRGRTDGTAETRELYADTDERRERLAQQVMAMTNEMARIKAEAEAVRTQCARLQADLDGDTDPEKRERITALYRELQRDFRKLGEEYWALKHDAEQFHEKANKLMSRLLNTKSASHAWSILEEYREMYRQGEELLATGQADLDSTAFKMRMFDRAERESPSKAREFGTGSWEGKRRRYSVEQKIDKQFPTLVVVPDETR